MFDGLLLFLKLQNFVPVLRWSHSHCRLEKIIKGGNRVETQIGGYGFQWSIVGWVGQEAYGFLYAEAVHVMGE